MLWVVPAAVPVDVVVPGRAALVVVWGMGALIGGPPLVSGCCGSPWAADRPTSGRFRPACGDWLGPCRAVGAARQGGPYAAGSSSTGLPLSMTICSVSLAVYPQRTSWFR